jgi:hypothetical protein
MNPRLREMLRFLPIAIVLYLLSGVLFNFMAGRPQFWSSEEAFLGLLWNACFGIPFIVFGLMVAASRKSSGR